MEKNKKIFFHLFELIILNSYNILPAVIKKRQKENFICV